MEDRPVAFEEVIAVMRSDDELLLAFMDGLMPESGEHRCVAFLTCSRRTAERLLRELGSALNEK